MQTSYHEFELASTKYPKIVKLICWNKNAVQKVLVPETIPQDHSFKKIFMAHKIPKQSWSSLT